MPFNTAVVSSSGGGSGSTTSGLVTYNATRPVLADGASEPIQGDSLGNQYMNPGIYNTASTTHTPYAGSASSTTVLAANPARTGLAINNQDTTNAFWVNLSGGTAAADGTCIKIPASTTFIPPVVPTTAITAFATTGTPVGSFIQSS